LDTRLIEVKGGSMDHHKTMLELLGVSSLREYTEPASYEEIMGTGQYYLDLFEKVFAEGEVQTERIRDEIARNLAEIMQPDARARFGVANEGAIRQLLLEAGAEGEWDRQMRLFREGIGRSGLDPEQQSEFLNTMEALRDPFIDAFCAQAARLRNVPVESANELSLALAEMFKEECHADQVSSN
jgi:hypothetical protein